MRAATNNAIMAAPMTLINCPACTTQVSAAAASCPKCGHPIVSAARVSAHKGPPHECTHCGGKLKKTREATSSGSGCIVVILGVCLAPVLIGIPIFIYGFHLMGKTRPLWQCRRCHAQFPRIRRWFQFS